MSDDREAYIMQWRVCPRFPDYEVSECGDVRRCVAIANRPVGFRLRGFINQGGYISYAVTPLGSDRVENIPAYRLVAEAFRGPPPTPSHEVAHNNGSRVSAHYTHLRWATRKENDHDMAVHGTLRRRERNGRSHLTDVQALDIRREYQQLKRDGGSNKSGAVKALRERYGLSQTTVNEIGMGKTWRHLPLEVE